MKQATWRVGLYSKAVLTIIAASLVGLLLGQAPIEVKAEQEFDIDEYIEYVFTEALITEFMEKAVSKLGPYPEGLMPYISKEYFESRWLNPDDFEVNFYSPSEFRILKVNPPYVDVEMIGGTETKWTTRLRFKVIREQNSFVIFPSRAEKTAYGNWVDPWWAIREEGIIKRITKDEVAPPVPFLFENVTVWEISRLRSGAVLGTRLTGEVVNQSGVTYNSHAWFKVTLYNRAGEVLGWREFTTFEFRDGERKRFKVFFNDVDSSDVWDWKIEFERGS